MLTAMRWLAGFASLVGLASGQNLQIVRQFNAAEGEIGAHVTIVGDVIYGVANNGLPDMGFDGGFIFRINSDGTGFRIIKNFTVKTEGLIPNSPLAVAGTVIYGTTLRGGSASQGTVFKINTDGTAYTILKSFSRIPDGRPDSGLRLDGSTLYGSLSAATTLGDGGIFRIGTDGQNYLVYSSRATAIPQLFPNAPPLIASGRIIGSGSLNQIPAIVQGLPELIGGCGVIYSVAMNDIGLTPLRVFPDDALGCTPALLVENSGWLYGTSDSTSSFSLGSVFRIKSDGTGFQTLHAFSATNQTGYKPAPSLAVLNGMIYGAASAGGPSNSGALYRLNTDGTDTELVASFSNSAGTPSSPYGVAATATHLYGGALVNGSGGSILYKAAVPVIAKPNTPPLFVQTPLDLTVQELALVTVTNTATDTDGPASALTYQLTVAPSGATIAATGVITWTPSSAQAPSTNIFVTSVSDGASSTSNQFKVMVTKAPAAPANTPPRFVQTPANTTIQELNLMTVTNMATDADVPANVLTYRLLGAPSGASISLNGVISWRPSAAQAPSTNNFITVVSDGKASLFNLFTVIVTKAPPAPINTPPVFVINPEDVTINEGTLLTITNEAIDADIPANVLSYQLLEAPGGALISQSGVITWTPGAAQAPSTNMFITAVSDGLESAFNLFFVVVTRTPATESNTPPVLAAIPNAVLDEFGFFTTTLTATDIDVPVNTLLFSLVSGPAGLTVLPNGETSWTPAELQGPGLHTVTVRVTDNGTPILNDTRTFTITVNEVNTSPVLTLPVDVTIDALHLYSTNAVATDADLPANSLTFALVSAPPGLTVSASGGISWTPALTQAPSINTVKIRVTDNGTPVLSTTNSFTITVNPTPGGPVLMDNLDGSFAGDFTFPDFDDSVWAAQSFNSGYNNLLTQVELNLRQLAPGTGTFFVNLYDASSPGVPGNRMPGGILASNRAVSSLGTKENATLTISSLSVLLTKNTEYFIVVGAEAPDVSGLLWSYSSAQVPGSSYNLTYDQGINWQTPDDRYPQRMRIESSYDPLLDANTPPELALPSDITIAGLSLYSANATATDFDFPPNTLTFALESGPDGVSVAPDGAIRWIPTSAQTPSINTVTISVTDDGSPALSVTNSFVVTVQPFPTGPVAMNNLSSDYLTDFYFPDFDPTVWSAQSFNSGENTRLTRVELNLHQMENGSGTFFVKLYDAASPGVPRGPVAGGTLAASQAVSGLGKNENATVVFQNLAVPLTTNTEYFIVVGLEGGDASGLLWSISSTIDPASSFNWTYDQGLTWFPPDYSFPQRMRIEGSTITPPSPIPTNTPPQLALPSEITIAGLSPYSANATAEDIDFPPNTLTFALVSGPEGLTVTSAGVISWTPDRTQTPSLNTVTIKVADNGSPALSATNSFAITVQSSGPGATPTNLLANHFIFPDFDDSVWAAQSFNSGNYSWLTEVALKIHRDAPSSGTFFVKLYDASSPGVPGRMLAGGALVSGHSISSLEMSDLNYWSISNLLVAVTPNTEYFIVVGANGNDAAGLQWSFSTTSQPDSSFNQSADYGTTWDPADFTLPQQMRVAGIINSAPTLAALPDLQVSELALLSITNSAADADLPANTLTFSVLAAPAGLSIDPASGLITWTPAEDQGPSTNLIVTVVSDGNASATNLFTIVVDEVNSAPTLAALPDLQVHAGEELWVNMTATDADRPRQTLSCSLVSGPTGLTVSPYGEIAWTPSPNESGTNLITIRVTDSGIPTQSATRTFAITVTAQPTISIEIGSNDTVKISWNSIIGKSYLLQYKSKLEDTEWTDVAGPITAASAEVAGHITATSEFTTTTDKRTEAFRFYRLLVLP